MVFQLIIRLAINQLTPWHAYLHNLNEILSINLTPLTLCSQQTSLLPPEPHRLNEKSRELQRAGGGELGSSPANKTPLTRNKCCLLCSLLCAGFFVVCDCKVVCVCECTGLCVSFILALHHGWLANSRLQPEVDKNQYIITWGLTHKHMHTHIPQPQVPQGGRQSKTNTQPTLVKVWFL